MARMKEFYRTVLAPLNYKEMVHNHDDNNNTLIGFGDGDHLPCLYLKTAADGQEFSPEYIAIDAKSEFTPKKGVLLLDVAIDHGADREEVHAFYNIAMYVGLGQAANANNHPFFIVYLLNQDTDNRAQKKKVNRNLVALGPWASAAIPLLSSTLRGTNWQ
jgi:hypothetical protein